MISKIDIMFSCELKCLNNFISRKILFASIESLKASLIFFIATFSPVNNMYMCMRISICACAYIFVCVYAYIC